MSGKPRTRQRQRGPATSGRQRRGRGNGGPAAQPVASAAARRQAAAAAGPKMKPAPARQAQRRAARRRKFGARAAIAAGVAAAVAGLFVVFHHASSSGAGAYPYQVDSPGPGQRAPGFTLAASTGGRVSLSQYRGKSVLLFFQEGLTCQPCWNQITDLEKHAVQLRAAGIGRVISVTGDPAGPVAQKARDMGLTIPVLSDPGLTVSRAYHATRYTMMDGRDGHTFILVGPDGKIRWRADYGGPPKYIMFLPTAALLADVRAGEHPS